MAAPQAAVKELLALPTKAPLLEPSFAPVPLCKQAAPRRGHRLVDQANKSQGWRLTWNSVCQGPHLERSPHTEGRSPERRKQCHRLVAVSTTEAVPNFHSASAAELSLEATERIPATVPKTCCWRHQAACWVALGQWPDTKAMEQHPPTARARCMQADVRANMEKHLQDNAAVAVAVPHAAVKDAEAVAAIAAVAELGSGVAAAVAVAAAPVLAGVRARAATIQEGKVAIRNHQRRWFSLGRGTLGQAQDLAEDRQFEALPRRQASPQELTSQSAQSYWPLPPEVQPRRLRPGALQATGSKRRSRNCLQVATRALLAAVPPVRSLTAILAKGCTHWRH